jgi:hypothetical protein
MEDWLETIRRDIGGATPLAAMTAIAERLNP